MATNSDTATRLWGADEGSLPPRVAKLHDEIASAIPCYPATDEVRTQLKAMTLLDLLGVYMNWVQRLIPARPRKVGVLPNFWGSKLAEKHADRVLALKAVASGELTPSEAAELGKLIEAHVKAVEATEIEARLRKLEAAKP